MKGKQRILFGASIVCAVVLLTGALSFRTMPPRHSTLSDSSRAEEKSWRVLDGITYQNLTVFPVVTSVETDTSEFATLDKALASGDALVTEEGSYLRRSRDGSPEPAVYSGAQVNQLVLVNRGKRPLLLLAGEVVSGGKQDRIIGKDRIVPVGAAPLPLDVFCVEHGRWSGGSDKFAQADTMVHPTVREEAAVEQDQSKVWAAVGGAAPPIGVSAQSVEVDSAEGPAAAGAAPGATTPVPRASAPVISSGALSEIAVAAPTQSYRKIYQSPKLESSVEGFAQEIERQFRRATSDLKGERAVGVVVAYGGEPIWSDIFASADLFETYWPKLLRSYVVEALTRSRTYEKLSVGDARDFLRPATGHIREESEPGVYLWREQTEGRLAEIQIEALQPKPITLHWMRVVRGN
jgi:hypothetical protein